jgi:hypothetical protein
MTRFKILGAAAILASALASPAMAQQVIYNPGYCAQFYPNANCQYLGSVIPHAGGGFRRNMNAVMLDHTSEPSRLEAYRHHGGPKSDY